MFIAVFIALFSSLKTYAGNRKKSVWVLAGAAHCLLLAAGLFSFQLEAVADVTVWPNISLIKVNGGLTHPVHITNSGDRSGRLFVVEQDGHPDNQG